MAYGMFKKFAAAIVMSGFCFAATVVAHPAAKHSGAEQADKWVIIHAGTLLDSPGQKPKTKFTILVKNDRIDEIKAGFLGPDDFENKANANINVIDLSNKFVMPGLIDSHVHLGLGGSYSKGKSKSTGQDTYRLIDVLQNAQKTLSSGYTTVRNVGSYDWAVFALRDGINDGVLTGPRVFTAGHTIEISTKDDQGTGTCYSVETCKKAVRRQSEMGADLIKVYATCSGSKPCGSQSAPPVFLEKEMKAVIETANSRGLKVTAHGHSTAGINQALRLGAKSIEHGSYNDAVSHQLFIENQAYLVPTLAVQDNIIRDYQTAEGTMRGIMEGFMDQHPKRFMAAYNAGVKIAAGSDAGVIPHGQNVNELLWYVKLGMDENEAIKSATINAASLLGMEDEIGSLAQGKYADIIAVEGDPLSDIEALKSVSFVMQNGKIFKPE